MIKNRPLVPSCGSLLRHREASQNTCPRPSLQLELLLNQSVDASRSSPNKNLILFKFLHISGYFLLANQIPFFNNPTSVRPQLSIVKKKQLEHNFLHHAIGSFRCAHTRTQLIRWSIYSCIYFFYIAADSAFDVNLIAHPKLWP